MVSNSDRLISEIISTHTLVIMNSFLATKFTCFVNCKWLSHRKTTIHRLSFSKQTNFSWAKCFVPESYLGNKNRIYVSKQSGHYLHPSSEMRNPLIVIPCPTYGFPIWPGQSIWPAVFFSRVTNSWRVGYCGIYPSILTIPAMYCLHTVRSIDVMQSVYMVK